MNTRTSPQREAVPIQDFIVKEGLEGLSPARIATLYRRAPLLRPMAQPAKIWEMFEQSSLVLTAWSNGSLIGIARVLTDGVLYSYLCDLAVEPDVQGLGVGRKLIDEVLKRCKGTELVLRDSDISSSFYEHLGFTPVDNAWIKRS
jgi:GNAT superfamily N-acetyltransferase